MRVKPFLGPKVRALRAERGWRLDECARRLGLSASYLSQIESNQRPVSERVLMALTDVFGVRPEAFDADVEQLLLSDLREAMAEAGGGDPAPMSELRAAVHSAPTLARRFVALQRDSHRLTERLKLTEEAVALDEATAASLLLPYEEVRDYFHYKDNYIDALDRAAETLAETIGLAPGRPSLGPLEACLREGLGITVARGSADGAMRRFDPARRLLTLDASLPAETQAFQMAYQIASSAFVEAIDAELKSARFRTREAADVCRVGLANYAAGALLMPYRQIAQAARRTRHDIEQLARLFGASLEQVCHRLSTLQRPMERGVPLYFVRLDNAGNITKRHSATRFRFARFGGACPLWNVHEAWGSGERFQVQLAEMPDGVRYLCVAVAVVKPAGSYLKKPRRYVLGLGCEIEHAHEMVYAEGIDLDGPAAPIGVSCRICERDDCEHRAFPPVDRPLAVPSDERRVVPYRLGS